MIVTIVVFMTMLVVRPSLLALRLTSLWSEIVHEGILFSIYYANEYVFVIVWVDMYYRLMVVQLFHFLILAILGLNK